MTGWTVAAAVLAGVVPVLMLGVGAYLYHLRRQGGERGTLSRPVDRPGEQSPGIRFTRDVAVNVVANLVAVAILYLFGAAAGLLPRSPYLIFSSVVLILVGLGIALGVVGMLLRGHAKVYVFCCALILGGLGQSVAPLVREVELDSLEKILYPIGGVAAVVVGASGIVSIWRNRDGERR
ncbi:hypothetical protein [Micromonospora sp. NPDC126480]|uniref:hypothetical protein n=1 Tax=Micromonospora sp. NPDC126480 TaxID=3155312 RepID=UPI003330C519